MSMQAVILAAGKGTRLAPITTKRSKGMLPILGKPIFAHIIQGMLSSGVRNFILVVNPADREIREYIQKEFSPDVLFQFIQQDRQLGTAHALALTAPLITGDFLLSACDSLVPVGEMDSLVSTWSRHAGLHGLLSLERIQVKDSGKTGIVTLEGDRVVGIVEKPSPAEAPSNISSAPLYAFSRRLLDYLPQVPESPRGEYELQHAIQMMIDDGLRVNGIYLDHRLSLTTAEDLLAINLNFLYALAQKHQVGTINIGSNTNFVKPVFIEDNVEIGSNCVIGPGVYIEKDVRIGDGVQLENTVVLRDTAIADRTRLKGRVIS